MEMETVELEDIPIVIDEQIIKNNFIGRSDHIFIPDEDNDCYLEVLNLILIFKF